MDFSGQFHAPAILLPEETKITQWIVDWRDTGPDLDAYEKKWNCFSCRESKKDLW